MNTYRHNHNNEYESKFQERMQQLHEDLDKAGIPHYFYIETEQNNKGVRAAQAMSSGDDDASQTLSMIHEIMEHINEASHGDVLRRVADLMDRFDRRQAIRRQMGDNPLAGLLGMLGGFSHKSEDDNPLAGLFGAMLGSGDEDDKEKGKDDGFGDFLKAMLERKMNGEEETYEDCINCPSKDQCEKGQEIIARGPQPKEEDHGTFVLGTDASVPASNEDANIGKGGGGLTDDDNNRLNPFSDFLKKLDDQADNAGDAGDEDDENGK